MLRVVDGGVEVEGTWRLEARKPGWFANLFVGPTARIASARRDRRPAGLWAAPSGNLVVERVAKRAQLTLNAFVPGDPKRGAVQLDVLGAVAGTVRVVSPTPVVLTAPGGAIARRSADSYLSGAARLQLEPAAPKSAGTDATIAIARAGVGVTVGDAEVRGRAHLRWEVRRGQLTEVSATIAGVGEDLVVEGPTVRDWKRSGDRLRVQLKEPARARVDLQLAWSVATPRGESSKLALPEIAPENAWRTESALEFARDGDVDFIPELPKWNGIASARLPPWAEGLVEGTPTAAYQRSGAGDLPDLPLYRFIPVPGPPVVVDVADIAIAASEEGRVLMRARYEVRNERASHLRVQPPPGLRAIAVDVAGAAVTPGTRTDAPGQLLVPLKRSVETVDGLISVPVVVVFLGDTAAWGRRERREIALPVVDAPITTSRASLGLPRDYRSLRKVGEGAVVESFTRGREYEFAFGDDAGRQAQADELFKSAVDAWQSNEFEQAQDRLDELEQLGASNENTERLQSNVSTILGPRHRDQDGVADSADDDAAPIEAQAKSGVVMQRERRIRARARARGANKRTEQRKRLKKAEDLRAAGDYDAAEAEYEAAIETGKELERLEDEESKDTADETRAVEADLKATKTEKRRARRMQRVRKFVADDAEYALVGPSAEYALGVENAPARPAPALRHVVPFVDNVVRYQHALIEPSGRRVVRVDARRPVR